MREQSAILTPNPFQFKPETDQLLFAAELLLVDNAPDTASYAELLRTRYRAVNVTPYQRVALNYIQRAAPSLVVTNLTLEDGSGLDLCRAVKLMAAPASLLVTTNQPEEVPDALIAGCDSVLLKPFPVSLFVNRLSRMLRERSRQLRLRSARAMEKGAHLADRSELARMGTNREWPNTHCPYCDHEGVTSFDYAGLRRAWYACLACRKVWLAKRQDER